MIDKIIKAIFLMAVVFLSYKIYITDKNTSAIINKEEDRYKEYTYQAQTISELRRDNKVLYDSLKEYKDKLEYAINFQAELKVKTGLVKTKDEKAQSIGKDSLFSSNDSIKKYIYTGFKDSMDYKITIYSACKPYGYDLDYRIKQNFIIGSSKLGDMGKTKLIHGDGVSITRFEVFQKKKKKSFKDRFAVGPQISVGYDFLTKEPSLFVGFGVTFDVLNN